MGERKREGETCTPINKVSSWGNLHPLNAAAAAAKAARVGVASLLPLPVTHLPPFGRFL